MNSDICNSTDIQECIFQEDVSVNPQLSEFYIGQDCFSDLSILNQIQIVEAKAHSPTLLCTVFAYAILCLLFF